MDEDRRIRFLVAPILFIASILWAIVLDKCHSLSDLLSGVKTYASSLSNVATVIIGTSIAIFALGFLIGTINYVVLRTIAYIFYRCGKGSGCHESILPSQTIDRIWKLLQPNGGCKNNQQLFAAVTFDHYILKKNREGIHEWLRRRWSAVSIGTSSATGLLLSLLIGHLLGIRLLLGWWMPILILSFLCLVSALFAWRDTMRMTSFQVSLEHIQ